MKKILLILFILFLFPFLSQCFKAKQNRIIGGHRVKPNQFPYFAQLYMIVDKDDKDPASCGATLIHQQWILTAGHCLHNIHRAWVNMGKIKVSEKYGSINHIKTIHVHPGYVLNTTREDKVLQCLNDVAVAKLEKKYKFSKSIKTIILPNKIPRCKTGTIIGIGQAKFYPDYVDPYIKYAIIHTKERKDLSNPNIIPPSKTLFFSEVPLNQKGFIYFGDSGGPYLCTRKGIFVQYGICSQSDNNTVHNTIQSAFESVYKHMDFILKYVPDVKIYKGKTKKDKSLLLLGIDKATDVKTMPIYYYVWVVLVEVFLAQF